MLDQVAAFFAGTEFRWWDVVDILIVAFLVYELLQFIRGTHAVQIALGGLLLVFLYWASVLFNLQTVNWLLRTFLPFLVFGIIVVFQAEIRKGLAHLGRAPFLGGISVVAPRTFEGIRGAALNVTGPVAEALFEVKATANGLVSGAGDYWDAARQNGKLKRDREAMLRRMVDARAIAQENRQLKAALGLRETHPEAVAAGRVVGSSFSSPRRYAILSVGSNDGVAVGMPVRLENDANAAAFGEYWRGAGRGCASMALLTLGTGVGGGLVLGGALWRGADGMAGEVGHITVDPGGRTCRCGNAGCLETYASATAIVDRYRELSGAEEAVTADLVHARALEGDANARQAYREAGRALGLAFATLVNLLNPERIVIGGGVLPAWELFMPPAEQELRRRAFAAPAARVRFARAALGDLAGVTGAGGLLWEKLAHG